MVDMPPRVSRRSYLKRGAGVVAVSGLSGCTLGGGGGSGTETLTIAAAIPETGSYSSLGGDLKRGYELGVERMREELDRDVEYILRDDESDAQTLREQLQSVVSNNDVNVVWGSFSSLLVTAGSAFAENEGLPFLGVTFAYEAPHRNDNYEWTFAPFPKSRDIVASTVGMLDLIPEAERPTDVGIWEPNSGWGEEMADYWEEYLTDEGYEVVLREIFEIGSTDFSTLISQSESADVEALLSCPTPPGGITAVNQIESSAWTPDVLKFVRAADPTQWWSALGETGAYAMMSPGPLPPGHGGQELRETYRNRYEIEGEFMPIVVGSAYNLAQVTTQAVSAAGSVTPADVRDSLRTETFDTVLGDFGFEENGIPKAGQITTTTGQWWDGNQMVVYPRGDSDRAMELKHPVDW
jgi:branched-chain amino acid transport system substrate-binding protein